MKAALTVLVLLGATSVVLALPIGECYPDAELRRKLREEGQQIISTSEDGKTLITRGSSNTGYYIEARSDGQMCVIRELQYDDLTKLETASDFCSDPAKYPEAKDECDLIDKEGLRASKSFSANMSQSVISPEIPGPVKAEFNSCKTSRRGENLCGVSETRTVGAETRANN